MMSEYGFYFEQAGRGRSFGDASPEEEHFKGMTLEEAVVRELAQNSIDAAVSDSQPVRIEVELAEMSTSDIPDFENLKRHITASVEATEREDGKESRLSDVLAVLESGVVPVLRVSDYGTSGLTGREDREHSKTPLAALTRGSGISAKKGGGGGSFGIGSAVGPMAGTLHTVLWTTRTEESPDVVFAGYSHLATHTWVDGTERLPSGIFTNLGVEDDFEYLRNPGPIGPFGVRTEPGTDTYILGYRNADEQSDLEGIREAFVRNFFVAIQREKLTVVGIFPGGTWELNAETIAGEANKLPDVRPYYEALLDTDPIVKDIPHLGEVQLYVRFNDSLEKKMDTIAMRSPLMKIKTFRSRAIGAKYAAIFICENDKGNEVLRALESPSHDDWQQDRASGGKKVHDAISKFIREGLRSRLDDEVGEEIVIDGLAKYLPSFVDFENSLNTGAEGVGTAMEGESDNEDESATVSGKPEPEGPVIPVRQKPRRVTVKKPADHGDEADTRQGKKSGGERKRESKGGGLPGRGQHGEGAARIEGDDVTMRSYIDNDRGVTVMKLTARQPVEGELVIGPMIGGGDVDRDYELPILSAAQLVDGVSRELEVIGNRLQGVSIPSGDGKAEIHLRLNDRRRYRLAVI